MKQRHLSVILGGLLVLLFTGLMFSCQGTNDPVAVTELSGYTDIPVAINTAIEDQSPTVTPNGATGMYAIEPALPTGLTLDTATGTLSGTPSVLMTSTTYTITFTASGNYTGTVENTFNLTVNAISVTELSGYTDIPSATVDTAIANQTPTVTPAEATGTYAIEKPPLPTGLTLDTDTGKLSGTPTEGSASAKYKIIFTASDNYTGTASQEITIAVLMADASPGAPTIGTLTAGDSQVTVSWTAPTDTGYNDGVAATITGYTVYYSKAENFTKVEDFTKDTADGNRSTDDGTATEIVVDGLTNEATYYFLVTATNDTGEGGSSAVMSFAPAGYTVGDTGPAGGIVFYVKNVYLDLWRYLEAPTSDQSTGTGIAWGGYGTEVGEILTAIGTGKANTDQIVSVLTTTEGIDRTTYAAGVCSEYSTTVGSNTFDDWFLPSKDELNELYKQRATVGGFVDLGIYWSSSEGNSNSVASAQRFSEKGEQSGNLRHFDSYVRAIRAF